MDSRSTLSGDNTSGKAPEGVLPMITTHDVIHTGTTPVPVRIDGTPHGTVSAEHITTREIRNHLLLPGSANLLGTFTAGGQTLPGMLNHSAGSGATLRLYSIRRAEDLHSIRGVFDAFCLARLEPFAEGAAHYLRVPTGWAALITVPGFADQHGQTIVARIRNSTPTWERVADDATPQETFTAFRAYARDMLAHTDIDTWS